jgi:hypothetical protein
VRRLSSAAIFPRRFQALRKTNSNFFSHIIELQYILTKINTKNKNFSSKYLKIIISKVITKKTFFLPISHGDQR